MPMLYADGISLHYSVRGKGVPIVFIHPPVLTSVNFQYQMEELSEEFKVITFDIRGHGRSQYSRQPVTYPLIIEDIKHLLAVLDRLVERGNTVMVIEHNLDMVKVADYVIDLGPEGGSGGGTILCTGTPEDVANCKGSHTGEYLKLEL